MFESLSKKKSNPFTFYRFGPALNTSTYNLSNIFQNVGTRSVANANPFQFSHKRAGLLNPTANNSYGWSFGYKGQPQQFSMSQSRRKWMAEEQAKAAANQGTGNTTAVDLSSAPNIQRWGQFINEAAAHYDVPPDLIAAVMYKESAGNPDARSPYNPGWGYAVGLMQTLESHYGPGEDPWDPRTNIMKGTSILRSNFDMAKGKGLSDDDAWVAAIAAYLGDWDWERMTFAGFTDVLGTGGPDYVQEIQQMRQTFQVPHMDPNLTVNEAAAQRGQTGSVWDITGGSQFSLTQPFGHTDFSRANPHIYGPDGHTGVDFAVPEGTTLYAPVDGEVVEAGWNDSYGNYVKIKTSWGYLLLAHLSGLNVEAGMTIRAGTVVGRSGNTGDSTGAHLHVETRDVNNNRINPNTIFSF